MPRVRTSHVLGMENSLECIMRITQENRTKKRIQEDRTRKITEGLELNDIGIKHLFSLKTVGRISSREIIE